MLSTVQLKQLVYNDAHEHHRNESYHVFRYKRTHHQLNCILEAVPYVHNNCQRNQSSAIITTTNNAPSHKARALATGTECARPFFA
ncbi:UNVERIFIED_CONTAM: hypothetical protein HHA_450640 [Hammondia hammondi]|eukprot:XP_008882991.1 hypothetical protein HHA_450640 [Hammondia hammondi]